MHRHYNAASMQQSRTHCCFYNLISAAKNTHLLPDDVLVDI